MAEVTYGRLDKVLRSLGFSLRMSEDPKAKIYEHKKTGALLALPLVSDEAPVQARHLAAVRATLDAYGIGDRMDLAQELQKV